MRFELFIAARYLRAKRRQAVVGLVTIISIAGVAAGVAALIIALAITNGMKHDLEDRLLGSTSHIELMRVEANGIRDWRPLLDRLRHIAGVKAAAPGIYGQVLVSRGARAGFALVKGIVPADERNVNDLLATLPAEAVNELNPAPDSPAAPPSAAPADDAPATPRFYPPILLGKGLAEQIGATVGDSVLVTSPQGELTPLGLEPRYQRFRVAGIFHSGFYAYDNAWAFTSLAATQQLFSEPDLLSVISFRITDLDHTEGTARAIEAAAGKGYMTTNWIDQNRELFRALKLEQAVTFIVIALIVLVAALNILIALTMMVMEKTRDIAVLMSYGVSTGQVRRIFLLQGFLISVIGTVIGLVLGYAAAWAGAHYHFIHVSAEVYNLDTLPFAPRAIHGLIVAALSIGVSLLATLYPSSSAAGILPAEALRYE